MLGLLQLFVKPGTDVVVRTGTDAEKVHCRYSGVVVRLTGLCVKIT